MRTAIRIFGIILIFLFGVFVGVTVKNGAIAKKAREVMMGGPESIVEVVVKRLDSELQLDPEQKRRLQTIADDAHIRLRQSHLKIQPEIDTALGEAEQRVRAMLYPNQVEKFDQLLNRSREKWRPKQKDLGESIPGETPLGTCQSGKSVPRKQDQEKEISKETPLPSSDEIETERTGRRFPFARIQSSD